MTDQPLFNDDPDAPLHRLLDGLADICAEPVGVIEYVGPAGQVDVFPVVTTDDIEELMAEVVGA